MNAQTPSYEVTSDDKLWAALAYVFSPLVPIILLFMADKKDRPFIKAHNMQALILGVVMVIVTPILATVTCGIGTILWLLMLYLAYKAYQGQVFELPVITNFVRQQGW
jgi:uncharacterized membrane protein